MLADKLKRDIDANGRGKPACSALPPAQACPQPGPSEPVRLLKNRSRKMTQCEARRSDGRRCTRLVMRGRKVCHYHAGEDRREFMRQIAYKANEAKRKQKVEREAVRKPISSVAEAELILGSLIAQLHANHAPAKDLVAAIGCFLKSRELSLEAEIARISDQVAKMKLARTGRGVVDDWLPGQQEEFVDESEE